MLKVTGIIRIITFIWHFEKKKIKFVVTIKGYFVIFVRSLIITFTSI